MLLPVICEVWKYAHFLIYHGTAQSVSYPYTTVLRDSLLSYHHWRQAPEVSVLFRNSICLSIVKNRELLQGILIIISEVSSLKYEVFYFSQLLKWICRAFPVVHKLYFLYSFITSIYIFSCAVYVHVSFIATVIDACWHVLRLYVIDFFVLYSALLT